MIKQLEQRTGLQIYPRSIVEAEDVTFFLGRGPEGKRLGIQGNAEGFTGTANAGIMLCPLTTENATALRARLPWLNPTPLGVGTSAGCGDRLGLATPGHIRALERVGGIAPILAQQSMRENARTGRTPQQVVDDAVWGIFQEGWREPWGADADHLKTTADIDVCVEAGYTFYTIDPGAHVDNEAHTDEVSVLREKFTALPWETLEDSPAEMRARYLNQSFALEGVVLVFDEPALLRAAGKYGRALAHTVTMARHLKARMADHPFDLEVSVDETETPTSPLEHFFIVNELRRLGVVWVSLAPRFVGRFEKGVDYIGDLDVFEAELIRHAAVMRYVQDVDYKLSLHSGSDKFSIYALVAEHTEGRVHLKTAGTSYLEALRAIAEVDPAFFREILTLALARYPEDRATYHVSAELAKVPAPDDLSDAQLPGLLDQFDARQVLHVTFGSVLDEFGTRLKAILDENEAAHYAALEKHFVRHLQLIK